MRYYPVNLDIEDRRCLVVGGGAVGTRKVLSLMDCGASVRVVSPDVTEQLKSLHDRGEIEVRCREYRSSDLEGAFLVIGATDDEDENRKIHSDASKLGILCNIADRPEICSFVLPAVVKRGDLTIAVSTSGKSPAFAKHLRMELEDRYGEEYTAFLELMGAIRHRLLKEDHAPEIHKPLFERLISGGLVDLIKEGDKPEIDRLLKQVLGDGFAYDGLV